MTPSSHTCIHTRATDLPIKHVLNKPHPHHTHLDRPPGGRPHLGNLLLVGGALILSLIHLGTKLTVLLLQHLNFTLGFLLVAFEVLDLCGELSDLCLESLAVASLLFELSLSLLGLGVSSVRLRWVEEWSIA